MFTNMQREILRAIELHGGITPVMTDANGWTFKGNPRPEFNQLIRDYKLVAPRVLTSQPLRVVWQMRATASHAPTLAKIASEVTRLKLKEYAPGGFMLELRKELKR